MKWFLGKPSRDSHLGEALRRLEPAPRNDEALRRRIVLAAQTRLAELSALAARSQNPRWWEWLDRWIPVAVPVGLAASVAAALLLPAGNDSTLATNTPVEVVAESTLVAAAYSEELGAEQVAAGLIAPQGGEWLFEEAVIQ